MIKKIIFIMIYIISTYNIYAQTKLNCNNYISLKIENQTDQSSISINTNTQTYVEQIDKDSISRIYSQITIGVTEIFSFSIGYTLDEENTFGLKFNDVLTSTSNFVVFPENGTAVGLEYSYSFNTDNFIKNINLTVSIINSISIDESVLSNNSFLKGFLVELTTGNKKKYDNGFSFIYEVGILMTQIKNRETRYWPSFKIGTNYNF